MKKLIITIFVILAIGNFGNSNALVFTDDFNDGDLVGWTAKQGYWSNPGDHLLSSFDNYGIIWKDYSFGFDQWLQVDAYFDDALPITKSAQLRLRSGEGGGGNSYFDHGYRSYVQQDSVGIYNTTAPGQHQLLGSLSGLDFAKNKWMEITFSVTGLGDDTNLLLWVNNILYLDVFDTFGNQHDDGGYLALGSSNHINRYIQYDNALGSIDEPISEPAVLLLFGTGFAALMTVGIRRKTLNA